MITTTQIQKLTRKLAGMSREDACRELYGWWITDQVCGSFADVGAEDRHFELVTGIEENEDNTASAAGLMVLCDFADELGVEPELSRLTRATLSD